MKRKWEYTILILSCLSYFSACFEYPPSHYFIETRTVLYKTNIIGITGPSSEAGEEYVEIRYSAADDENPGRNKTESIMVSPPYVFQNDRVYMQYDLYEYRRPNGEVLSYQEILIHDYREGGAEYLRIINHSADKTVEFFFAGGQDMPGTIEEFDTMPVRTFENTFNLPSVRYKKAPVQYLLFPDRKPGYNFVFLGTPYTFAESSCGDITVIEPWTVDAVNELYRAEYKRSDEIRLSINYDDAKIDEPRRMIDMVEGVGVSGHENSFAGKVFWGSIKPGESLEGSDKIWLPATSRMFRDVEDWEI
jgi:hypothetical protein